MPFSVHIRILVPLLLSMLLGACASMVSAVREEPIQEDPSDRSFGTWADDESIEFTATVNLRETDPGFVEGHVVVVSHNGVVLLVGQIGNKQLRAQAAEVVAELKNVRQVHNELTVGAPISWPARSNDAWLTTKIRSRLLFTEGIDSGAVKVTTENNIVYLQGMLRRSDADLVVATVQKSYGVQKIVRVFEYVD